ncbi:MAG: glycosyltransferase family 9 protein [Bacteroidetes bacterium]|nr:glycosyltransferase family 9 protein [Bacteroidota bacterium]
MQKILVIQTAFIGDVILATGILEKLHKTYPDTKIDFLLRKDNESLFDGHPFLNQVLIWDKKKGKYKSLLALLRQVRKVNYDFVINVQRFGATGILTAFSRAKYTVGFDKNPFSFFFSKRVKHIIGTEKSPLHEIDRNQMLIAELTEGAADKPKLYPTQKDDEFVNKYKQENYVCIAPASIWFTKQFPTNKWVELLDALDKKMNAYLLGANSDKDLCDTIINSTQNNNVTNLAGKLSLLQSASLLRNAANNYVNDSSPMHLASSVNAITTAIYCSTLPSFGFGPLSTISKIIEVEKKLVPCRPCGLHGKVECPKGHFNCAKLITITNVLK